MRKFLFVLSTFLMLSANSFAQKKPTADEKVAHLLPLVGTLSAISVYNTYGYIGVTSDAFEKGSYDASTATSVLTEQVSFCKNGANKIEASLQQNDFEGADIPFMKQVLETLRGLSKQAQYCLDYIKNKTSANATLFQEQRKKNWELIKKILDLKD